MDRRGGEARGGEVSEGTPRSVIRFSFNPPSARCRLPGNIDIINIRISRRRRTSARVEADRANNRECRMSIRSSVYARDSFIDRLVPI